jgi:pilus assembly protein Flp/PilA
LALSIAQALREKPARYLSRTVCLDRIAGSTGVNLISRFLKDETAATAIEYGLIAAGIAVNGLGSTLNTKFSSINSSLK